MNRLVSVFTPSNNPKFLNDLHDSLVKQSYKSWEWVVAANGDRADAVLATINSFSDKRIRAFKVPNCYAGRIGYLKNLAASACHGEVLIEVDHDDWLVETCLEKIAVAYVETGADFIYSQSLGIREDGTSEIYRKDHGWEYGTHEFNGREYPVMLNFPIHPRSLAEIYYCPNHIRAWSAPCYNTIGGHDQSLAVADDHDLMCRTYIAGGKFHEIPEVLYYQRRHNESVCAFDQPKIAQATRSLMNKYLHQLIYKWCSNEKLLMLDFGGAHNCPKEKGFLSVDLHSADVVCDVTKSIPFPAGKIGCIRAADFFEHIDRRNIVKLMNNIYSVLADGGFVISDTPAIDDGNGNIGRGAFQDPTHLSQWSENNTWYFTIKHFADFIPEFRGRFQSVRLNTHYPSNWHIKHKIPYLTWDFMACKGRRLPGLMLI